jgi:tRNA/tmRNA/rRNA uracil-C5-methylase (TrmA/RlmC/RlmD family)
LKTEATSAEEVTLYIDSMANGGQGVGRLDGRVVFVRGAIPGETVRVQLTNTRKKSWWAGEVTEVIEASSDRVVPPCPVAAQCGGCDFQHITLERQRKLKAQVVADLLKRIAGLEMPVVVEPADDTGLGWRSRMRYLVVDGVPGFRAHRSHDLVPMPKTGCPLALDSGPDATQLAALANRIVEGQLEVSTALDDYSVWSDGQLVAGSAELQHHVNGVDYRVSGRGFWQVHRRAPQILVDAVLAALQPQAGHTALDLYCGVGLFAGQLAKAGARVNGVESDSKAVELARDNVPNAKFHQGSVEKVLKRLPEPVDMVVLDPPRAGAGEAVVTAIANRQPQRIAYVSCDAATLARDLKQFRLCGYQVGGLRCFDLFPMSQHIETLAVLCKERR